MDPALHSVRSVASMPMPQVAAEPAALQRRPIVAEDWAPLIGAVDNLVIRVSVLESLLEGRGQHLRSAFFTKFFGVDLLPSFRQVQHHTQPASIPSADHAWQAGHWSHVPEDWLWHIQ